MTTEGLMRSYGALLVGALVPIWTASHASIQVPKSVKRKWRESKGSSDSSKLPRQDGSDDEDEEDDETEVERLTTEDAYLFPVLGSCVLGALFLAFKYLDKSLLNRILGGYLALMGTGALSRTLADLTARTLGDQRLKKLDKYKVSLNKNKEELSKISFTKLHVFASIGALALTFAQQYTQHWILSNLLALSFAYSAISLFYLDTIATGMILLAGLFVYDIWWVFGSKAVFGQGADVMVSVAKNFDAPIKIVFPKDISNAKDFTLLGLGDIVLPGAFLALALRFDYHQATQRALVGSDRPPRPTEHFAKPYFLTSFVAYIAGLVTTIFVMHHFRAAQPALLYLSPACIGSVTILALVRGESKQLFRWEDGEEERKERERKDKIATEQKKLSETGSSDSVQSENSENETAAATSIEGAEGRTLRSRTSKLT